MSYVSPKMAKKILDSSPIDEEDYGRKNLSI